MAKASGKKSNKKTAAKASSKAKTKKAAAKKSTTKKAATAKAKPAKKVAAKKTASKKAAPKKAASKKTAAKKTSAKKVPAKKAAAKTAKKATKKAAPAKKEAPKQAAPKAEKKSVKTAAKPKKETKKIAKPVVVEPDPIEEEDRPIQVEKPSPFSAQELQEWRALLKQRYSEVSGDIQNLIHDAIDSEDGHTMPTHQADRGSDVDMQDLSLGMLGDEETILWQIERALHKIDTGTPIAFGLCEHTYNPISIDRLTLIPWTPLSIQGAAYMEESGYTLHDMIIDE